MPVTNDEIYAYLVDLSANIAQQFVQVDNELGVLKTGLDLIGPEIAQQTNDINTNTNTALSQYTNTINTNTNESVSTAVSILNR
jgi:hypothetical protein